MLVDPRRPAFLVRTMYWLTVPALIGCGNAVLDPGAVAGDGGAPPSHEGGGGAMGVGASGGDAGIGFGGATVDIGCAHEGFLWEISNAPSGAADRGGVWGANANDVWLVGEGENSSHHFDGSAWSPASLGFPGFSPVTISGTAADEVYVASASGEVVRYDGASWVFDGLVMTDPELFAAAPATVVAVGGTTFAIREGGTWSASAALPSAQTVRSVHGSGPADVFAVGDLGTALHYDGIDWTSVVTPTSEDLKAVWSSGPNAAVAVGDGGVVIALTPDGAAPLPPLPVPFQAQPLSSVWISDDADFGGAVFAVSVQSLHAWDGEDWTTRPIDFFDSARIVWGANPAHMVVAGAQSVVSHCILPVP